MRPLDPRLLRYASATRATLAAGGLLALAQTAAVVAFAWLVTNLIVGAIEGRPQAAIEGDIAALAGLVIVRAVLHWLSRSVASRGGALVIRQLRAGLVSAIGRLGPEWVRSRSSADVALVAGRGMDALDGYFASYIPQLVLTAVATPVIVAIIAWQDLTSGIIIVLTLPLVPLFMVLVGWATQAAQKRQAAALGTLSRGFVDVVGGLSTLKLFGRQHRQEARIRQLSDDYRVRTMSVLRMSFLSGFVLELAASLSVALVAVTIGLRLLGGSLDLSVGLFVLLLAPEAFLPLRNVGASYHAASEGIEAAESAFAVLEASDSASTEIPEPRNAREGLIFENVVIAYDGRPVVGPFSAVVEPGTLAVLSAPSGTGKSSLVAAALGFTSFTGRVSAGGRADTAGRRESIACAGQRPGLLAGTVAQNVALGADRPDPAVVAEALRDAAASELDPDTVLGAGGAGLSGGQAQRVAVARAIYRLRSTGCSVLLLDEPTSALDAATERRLLASLRRLAAEGVAVLVLSHRDAAVNAADIVLRMEVAEHAR